MRFISTRAEFKHPNHGIYKKQRVFRRLSLWETFAVAFTILLPIFSAAVFPDLFPDDFDAFSQAANGVSLEGFYYPHWALFILQPLTLFKNGLLAYYVWNTLNVLGMLYAVRVFGGKTAIVLLCNPMIFNVYFGGAVGIIAAGSAFYAYYLERRPILAGARHWHSLNPNWVCH
jgi:hypothetical protein